MRRSSAPFSLTLKAFLCGRVAHSTSTNRMAMSLPVTSCGVTFSLSSNRSEGAPPSSSGCFLPPSLPTPILTRLKHCRIAFRDVTRSTDSRTVRACLVPPRTPLTNKAPYLIFAEWGALAQAYVLGVMNSLPFDWMSRRYIETNLNYFILNMLTFPTPDNAPWERIGGLAARLSCVDERFTDFAAGAGVECGPLTDGQRNDMRTEIDALVARAYDLTVDELRFIFNDFTENSVSPTYRRLVLEWFEKL